MIVAIIVQFNAEVLRSFSLSPSIFRMYKKKSRHSCPFLSSRNIQRVRGTYRSLRDRSAQNHSRAKGRGPKGAGQKVVERVTASSPLHAGQAKPKQAKAWQDGVVWW